MDHGLRPSLLRRGDSRRQRLCAIMTVGNDADFHGVVVIWECPVSAIASNFLMCPLSTMGRFSVYSYCGGATI